MYAKVAPSRRAPLAGESIDCMWLSEQLWNAGLLSRERYIVEVKTHDWGHRGLVGCLLRLHLEYDNVDCGDAPKTLIFKYSPPTVTGRTSTIVQRSWREATFFDSPLPAKMGVPVVRVVYASGSDLFGEFVMIMEDAAARPSTTGQGLNTLFGDQIFGSTRSLEDDEKLRIVEQWWTEAAQVHARTLNNVDSLRQEHTWLRGTDWLDGSGRGRWELSLAAARRGWATTAAKVANDADLTFDDRLIALMERTLASSSWSVFQERIKTMDIALVHGDFHAANMWHFKGDDGKEEIAWLDWSEVGLFDPLAEIGQSLISDIPRALFPRARVPLRAYFGALNKKDCTFEQFVDDFARATVERWLFFLCILGAMPLPAKLVQYFHDQIVAFVDEFSSFEKPHQFTAMVAIL